MPANPLGRPDGGPDVARANPLDRGNGPHVTPRNGSGGFHVVPDYRFGGGVGEGENLPTYDSLAGNSAPSEQQLTLAAANAPLRFGYGKVRMGALVANALLDASGALLLDCVIGEGPVHSLVSGEMNDVALPPAATITFYDGTQTTPDSSLVAAWLTQGVTYADVRPGVSWALIRIPNDLDISIDDRSITFEVKLLKVYDPRDGTQSLTNKATWKWTDNAALALANFLSGPLGPGDIMDWTSVGTVADRCDTVLAGKKRYTVNTLFDQQVDKMQVEETLRGAAGCIVSREGPVTYLVADAPVDLSTTLDLQPADWLPTTLRYSQRDADHARNSVTVRYTNTAVKPWAEAYTDPPLVTAEVSSGDVDEFNTVINAPWIQDYAEAVRLQKRYFAEYTLGVKDVEFEAFEKAWKIRRGDVIRVSDGRDLVQKAVRVGKLVPLGFAKVKVSGQEYDPAMYPDDAPPTPPTPGPVIQSPNTVIAPTGLTMVEEIYLDQTQGSTIASGAKWLSRFRLTWTHSTDRYRLDYAVEFLDGTTLVVSGSPDRNEFVSPAVEQGRLYKARVRTRNVLGFFSPGVEQTATALGKLLPPGDVPAITRAFEIGGEVLLYWQAAIDIDVLRYEWRYFPNGTGTWDTATFIDRVDSLSARFRGLPVGTHRFFVKAIDTVAQYSTNAAFVDITVTSDANAFLQDREFTSPTLTRMIVFHNEGEHGNRWITNHDESWDTLFPSAMTTYPNPVTTYGTGDSKFQGESWDLGEKVTGDWTLTASLTDHSGTATYAIESSDDGSTWTSHSGLTWTGAARYTRPVIATTGAMEIAAAPKMSFAAVARKESGGPLTSSAASATTITLSGHYVKAVRITITPRGTAGRAPTVDNVVLSLAGANTFDVYLFDMANNQVASDFTWDFEGF